MMFLKAFSSFSYKARLAAALFCMSALMLYGFYFIYKPSRTFTAAASFRYFPEDSSKVHPGSEKLPPSLVFPDYFLSKPSLYQQVRLLVNKKTKANLSTGDIFHHIHISRNEKNFSFRVRSSYENPDVAAALVKAFSSELMKDVDEAELGHIRKTRKNIEKELKKTEDKLAVVKMKLNRLKGKHAQSIQEKVKLLENTKEQTELRKAEAEGVLSKLLWRLKKERPRVVSGTTVDVNTEYKEAKFKLLDLQNTLRRKKEDASASPSELHVLESQMDSLNKKINTKIPKYIEVPTMNSNPLYEFLSQRVLQQRLLIASLNSQRKSAEKQLRDFKKEVVVEGDKSSEEGKLLNQSEIMENQIYLLQGGLVDLKLEELQSGGNIILISRSPRARVLKPKNVYEIAVCLMLFALFSLYAFKLFLALRMGVFDFPAVLGELDIPVLAHHEGLEKDNIYIARALAYIGHEMSLRTILFLSCSPQVSSSVVGDVSVHLSQKIGKVLLVDADFNVPTLHGFFESSPMPGLCQLFTDDAADFAASEELLVREIEKRIVPITSQCGFMGAGFSEKSKDVSFKKIKSELVNKFFNMLKTYDVLVIFYAHFSGNENLLNEMLPHIEGVVLCGHSMQEIYAGHMALLSFLNKYQHKSIGGIIFNENMKKSLSLPVMYRMDM